MNLSIIVPVYNEQLTIGKIIEHVICSKLPKQIECREIVIVDDFSTDGTIEKIDTLIEKYGKVKNCTIKKAVHDKNYGKGRALKTGFENASGDIVIIQDADLEYDPNEYSKLLQPILDNNADVVYGSRFTGGESHRILYFWHSLGNKALTLLSNMLSNLNLTDMETCYKVFRKEVIDRIEIEEERFGFEPEITAKMAHLARTEGVRIYEVGISYYGRTYEEGKKIKLRDAFRALWCILLYNTTALAKFIRYSLNGIIVAFSQYLSIFVLVEWAEMDSILQKNIANIISIEIAILVAFILHSKISWRYKFNSFGKGVVKFLLFHLVTGISVVVRIGLFPLLLSLGLNYKLDTVLCILVAVVINFIGYNKLVFIKKISKA